VSGPNWSDDDPVDSHRILTNVAQALVDAAQMAATRMTPTVDDLRRWHTMVFAGCTVPSPSYVGGFRGDAHVDLVDYEVGIGPTMPDGWPECMGVWARFVDGQMRTIATQLTNALGLLDGVIPVDEHPTTVDDLKEVVSVVAIAHGELVRIHPFVNGNGRVARLLTAHISLRYGLPAFVRLKPRPGDVAYARAAKRSMGRPPAFIGEHSEAVAVFTHLLALEHLGLPP
jgi:Fic/DOC family